MLGITEGSLAALLIAAAKHQGGGGGGGAGDDGTGLVVFGILWILLGASLGVITILKGKYGYAIGGLFIGIFWWVGAIRLAKPTSWWARNFYANNPRKMMEAQRRFPDQAAIAQFQAQQMAAAQQGVPPAPPPPSATPPPPPPAPPPPAAPPPATQ